MTTIEDLLAAQPEPAGARIRSTTVDYALDGVDLEGVLVKDAAAGGRRPGVLVIHEWNGVNDYAVARATMLARLGHVALVADIFGRGVRPGDAEAPQVAGRYYADLPLLRARAAAGLDQLLSDPDVDPTRVAVIGYCFGGSAALELARTGAGIAGVVSFHGGLITHDPSDADRIQAKLLVLTGAADPVVPADAVAAWERELGATGVDWQVVTYAGAMHAFTNPTANVPDHGAQHHPLAERRAWQAMRDFFAEIL